MRAPIIIRNYTVAAYSTYSLLATIQSPTFLPLDNKDYQLITPLNLPLFDDDTRRLWFSVAIIDDDILELEESFLLTVSVADPLSVPVQILPNVSVVTIVDNESKYLCTLNPLTAEGIFGQIQVLTEYKSSIFHEL